MNRDECKEFLKKYEGEEYITVTIVTNEDEYTIEDGESLGGSPNTYMSELIGNEVFETLESAGLTVYDYIVNTLGETVEEVYI